MSAHNHVSAGSESAGWRPIDTAPIGKSPHDRILVGFMGQFAWCPFVAYPMGADTSAPGYAKPTHWAPIQEGPK